MVSLDQQLALAGYTLRGPVWHGGPGEPGTSSLTGYAERYGTHRSDGSTVRHVIDIRPDKRYRKGLRSVLTVEERRKLRMPLQDVRDIRRRDVTAAIEAQIAKRNEREKRKRLYRRSPAQLERHKLRMREYRAELKAEREALKQERWSETAA